MSHVHQTITSQYSRGPRRSSSIRYSQTYPRRSGTVESTETHEQDASPEYPYSDHWQNTQKKIDDQYSRLKAIRREEEQLCSSLSRLVYDRVVATRAELYRAKQNYEEAVSQQLEMEEYITQRPPYHSQLHDPLCSSPRDRTHSRSQSLLFGYPGNASHLHPQDPSQRSPAPHCTGDDQSLPAAAHVRSSSAHSSSSLQPDSGPTSQASSRQTTMSDDLQLHTPISPLALTSPQVAPTATLAIAAPSSPSVHSPPGSPPGSPPQSASLLPSIPSDPSSPFAPGAAALTVPHATTSTSTSPTGVSFAFGSTMPTPATIILPLPNSSTGMSTAPIVHASSFESDQSRNSSREMSIESNNSYSKYNRFTDYGLSDVYMEVPEDVAGTEDKDDMVEQLGSEEEDHDHDDSRNDAAFLGQAIFDDPEVF